MHHRCRHVTVLEDEWVLITPQRDVVRRLLSSHPISVPLMVYDADLGMSTFDSITRQLAIDLPRSLVYVNGVRTTDPLRVVKYTFLPRMVTQACLAPVVEWFMESDLIACETRSPLHIFVASGNVSIVKDLALRTWDGQVMRTGTMRLDSNIAHDQLHIRFCSLEPMQPGSQSSRR